jgi:hypothetical protein
MQGQGWDQFGSWADYEPMAKDRKAKLTTH